MGPSTDDKFGFEMDDDTLRFQAQKANKSSPNTTSPIKCKHMSSSVHISIS
jgi:hypothetical protein